MRYDDLHAMVQGERAPGDPPMPDNTFRPDELVKPADPRLGKLADVIQHPAAFADWPSGDPALGRQPSDPVEQFGPLIHRAPAIASNAIAAVFDHAADQLLRTADQVMQEAIDVVAQAKETAQSLRDMGRREALTIGKTAELARNSALMFKEERQRIVAFKRTLADIHVEAAE